MVSSYVFSYCDSLDYDLDGSHRRLNFKTKRRGLEELDVIFCAVQECMRRADIAQQQRSAYIMSLQNAAYLICFLAALKHDVLWSLSPGRLVDRRVK